WQRSAFGHLTALPANGRPVTRWDDRDEAWLDVVRGLRHLLGPDGADGERRWELANPYRGLGAFQIDDPTVFFGRQHQTARLLAEVAGLFASSRTECRLVPIVGPSGCGKSSLLRAGLLATIERAGLPQRTRRLPRKRMPLLVPGARPLDSLANGLLGLV